MNNLISKIMNHQEIHRIFRDVLNSIYANGPTIYTDMEILSYLYVYVPEEFELYKNYILKYMGIYYKKIPNDRLHDIVFDMYKKYILDTYHYLYTPVQASIIKGIKNNQCFSFSAPTSTGKSYVFRNIIKSCDKDIVIIVSSRALINEYYFRLVELIPKKDVNILTFIDKINTKRAKRNVFIVTPERCKELFKHKGEFDVEYFLFDEAQLSNEESTRGLYFDSIIRRIQASYVNAKFVFAHPFVKNPEAQIIKNHFDLKNSSASQYIQKNVGQMFYAYDAGKYYHFGIDKAIMGNRKVGCSFDPIENAIRDNGSVLIYTTKASIYIKTIFIDFKKYIDMCSEIRDRKAQEYIARVSSYLGATDDKSKDCYSNMLYLLKRGIVVHHGSLPLQARLVLEQFTQAGFCRICFATSTLEQGINMPFEVVFLNTFQASRPLALKNLIGRAGRSTTESKFDYGSIVIHKSNLSRFRDILTKDDTLKTVSLLEDDNIDNDYKEFRDAIISGTFSDEFNLTETQLEKLSQPDISKIIKKLLESMFIGDELIPLKTLNEDVQFKLELYNQFNKLYSVYLGRLMVDGEKSVFDTAVKIMIWKIHCKTFKNICFYRYAYASRLKERRDLTNKIRKATKFNKIIYQKQFSNLYAAFIAECRDIPNKNLSNFSMFGNKEIKAADVDYDRIVFDTYDYLDKIIGFKLSDIFYAAFKKYFDSTSDFRAEKLAKFVKYGTDNNKEIWMLRYGFTFEDIEWIKDYIVEINQEEIIFTPSAYELTDEKLAIIQRFMK